MLSNIWYTHSSRNIALLKNENKNKITFAKNEKDKNKNKNKQPKLRSILETTAQKITTLSLKNKFSRLVIMYQSNIK